jgi:N-acetyl sugar amidotransferase
MPSTVDASKTGATLKHQVCTKLVMDTTDPAITFDENGVCNYWREYEAFRATLPDAAERERRLQSLIAEIKAAGKGRKYDCLIGLSGGVDSSYLAYIAHKHGLRPLAMHFDNGWNSELAVSNIEKLVERFGFDLETFVMDWEEFRDLQRAYFKASVIDLEIPTDHMIFGALYKTAARHNIKYLLSGTNQATEWLLPQAWYYRKFDLENVRGIHKAFGERPMKMLPALGVWEQAWYYFVKGIRNVHILDLIDYNKPRAKQFLIDELGWRDYGGKHHESIFTRFYQGYILPRKFDVDKRKAHLSSMILSGQATREEALAELQQPTYDERLQLQDKDYVAKKLGFTPQEFEALLTQPNRTHEEFGTDQAQRRWYFKGTEIWGAMRRMVKKPFGR